MATLHRILHNSCVMYIPTWCPLTRWPCRYQDVPWRNLYKWWEHFIPLLSIYLFNNHHRLAMVACWSWSKTVNILHHKNKRDTIVYFLEWWPPPIIVLQSCVILTQIISFTMSQSLSQYLGDLKVIPLHNCCSVILIFELGHFYTIHKNKTHPSRHGRT